MTEEETRKDLEMTAADVPEEGMCECCRHKHRGEEETKDLINRLKRIEGQVRGIRTMVEEERNCVDIITQVMAATSALNSLNRILVSNHLHSCVIEDIQNGNNDSVEELSNLIQKLMK